MHVYYKNITRDSDSFDSFNRFMKTILFSCYQCIRGYFIIQIYVLLIYLLDTTVSKADYLGKIEVSSWQKIRWQASLRTIELLVELWEVSLGRRSQCYLPPDTSEHTQP